MDSPKFLGHEPCPKCRANGLDRGGNNLGIWEDHKYCFACGYLEKDQNLKVLKDRLDNKKRDSDSTVSVLLPPDCSKNLPEQAIKWLDKYDLSNIEKSWFLWSEQYQRLIYPVYDPSDNLLMYSGRNFPGEGWPKRSKYHIQGKAQDVFHVLGDDSPTLVIVEDVISAIKVSRNCQAMPLWGSNMGLERIRRLSGMFFNLWLWLDRDKALYALETKRRAIGYFDDIRVIITDKDPKEYNDEEIHAILFKERK